jgi:manganese-dependent inorganic pyrophosphatase
MILPADHILVLGHRHPDTDASTSAHGYAEFLGRIGRYDAPVVPAVLGELPPQSRFVFERAGVAPPGMLDDLAPRVCHVATQDAATLSTEARFRDAVELLIRSDRSMLPVLEEGGKLHSTFSHRRDISRFLFGFDVIPILGRLLTWHDIVAIPGARAAGASPADPELRGSLWVALEGDASWREKLDPDDMLVCGELGMALSLPGGRFPRWIVVARSRGELEGALVESANRRGACVMQYAHTVVDLLFSIVMQVRIGALDLGTGPCVGEFDFIRDVEEVITGSRCALPVLRADGSLAGVVSRSDLERPPRRRVILIDHFESSQAVAGIEHAEIIEIIDHHRVGDIQTVSPVRVDCRPVGSASTIVALQHFEAGLEPGRTAALLLLGGLVADTLCLTSPTTTLEDRRAGAKLAAIAGVALEEFGHEVLRAGDDLLVCEPAKIWKRDQKVFGIRNRTFAVAQLETVALEELTAERLDAFAAEVSKDFEGGSHLLSLLFITDVLRGGSWVTGRESAVAGGVIEACFGAVQPRPGWTSAAGVVSRKRQIIPRLLAALAERKL